MKDFSAVLGSIAMTALCWGAYGPVLQKGQAALGNSGLRAFLCVGIAYFIVGVFAPIVWLALRGEKGNWTTTGVTWSFGAGVITAIGALGIVLALMFGGAPLYVMPLVFGGAPVVNTAYTMFTSKSYRLAGPMFYAGLILVIAGAVTVLVFRPQTHAHAEGALSARDFILVAASVLATCLCWGTYGPILHNGQIAMNGSRMRPFICVGLAYFLVAVLAPLVLLAAMQQTGEWSFWGFMFALAGGTLGALGSLGIIMAFTFGGKPIYVMPLVFGGAPVVNTFVSMMMRRSTEPLSPFFYAGLIVVIAGAVAVLIFAPKGPPAHNKPAEAAT